MEDEQINNILIVDLRYSYSYSSFETTLAVPAQREAHSMRSAFNDSFNKIRYKSGCKLSQPRNNLSMQGPGHIDPLSYNDSIIMDSSRDESFM